MMVENGDLLRLAPEEPEVIDQVPVGRKVVVEAEGFVEAEDDLFRTRRRLMNHGTIVVGLVLDALGQRARRAAALGPGAVEIERFGDLRRDIAEAIVDSVEELDDRHARETSACARPPASPSARRSTCRATAARSSRSRSRARPRPLGRWRRKGRGPGRALTPSTE